MSARVLGTVTVGERIYAVLDNGTCFQGCETGGMLTWKTTTAVPGSFAHDWPTLAEPRTQFSVLPHDPKEK